MRCVGRAAGIHRQAITVLSCETTDIVRPGDRIMLGVTDRGDWLRQGMHLVMDVNRDTGVIFTWDPIYDVTNTACRDDFIFVQESEPQWSPYR